MKKCPGCGDSFVGFEKLCSVCRRKPEITHPDAVRRRRKAVQDERALEGKSCPTCGQKVRPKPKTNAERQRRYREKRHGKS